MLCHQRPDRSFFWKGKQFPVCARCTGVHIGYLSLPVFPLLATSFGWAISLALIVPAFLDGLLQGLTSYESHNYLRLITGILAGLGAMSLIAVIGQGIGRFLLTFF